MQACTELIPPTAVTHAVVLSFLDANSTNLVVAKTSLLQVFATKLVAPNRISTRNDPESPSRQNGAGSAQESVKKLVLIGDYPLSGTITSLASIKTLNTKSGGEALLVSTRDAKISLVEWDPETCGLSTTSIHYYEGEDLQGSPWAPSLGQCSSYLTVDPSSRCVALKFGLRHLALLPFRQAGDDLVEGDYDSSLDESPQQQTAESVQRVNGDANQTPYSTSFVLTLTALDPGLLYPIDLAFLYEYREPTIGVLSSAKSTSSSLLIERKGLLSYSVFTLDLEQRARTQLLSVSGLPYDIFKLVPLPLPVGGGLLIGANAVVHIDQAGKTNAVAVNDFATKPVGGGSTIPMHDQSDLDLRLENCFATPLDRQTGDVLLILSTGDMATVSFKIDGRSVSGVSIKRVSPPGDGTVGVFPSCAVSLDPETIFVGSDVADSTLLSFKKRRPQLSRKRSHAEMLGVDAEGSDDELDDEDDLYGGDASAPLTRVPTSTPGTSPDETTFNITDKLPNLAPSSEPVCARRLRNRIRIEDPSDDESNGPDISLDLVLPIGRGASSAIAFMEREISLCPLRDVPLSDATNIWCLRTSRNNGAGHTDDSESEPTNVEGEDFIVACKTSEEGKIYSAIYSLSDSGLEERLETDFEGEGETVDAGNLCGGTRIVQVLKGEIRCLDPDLGLAQIIPMVDEESDAELEVRSASFCDPYLLIVRNDGSVILLEANATGELDEVDAAGSFSSKNWTDGCLYRSTSGNSEPLVYQLSTEGYLRIYEMPTLNEPSYTTHGLPFLPPILLSDNPPRRTLARERIEEFIVTDIGDSIHKSPHLVARTGNGNVAIYAPFHCPPGQPRQSFTTNLRWSKVRSDRMSNLADDSDQRNVYLENGDELESTPETPRFKKQLRYLANVGGYSSVLLRGGTPSLLLKEASTPIRFVKFHEQLLLDVDALQSPDGHSVALLLSQDGHAAIANLPQNARYGDTGWSIQQRPFDEDITAICYHPPSDLYVLGTTSARDFKLPDDDWHQEWSKEEISMKPKVDQGSVKLFDRANDVIIQEIQMEPEETVLCIKCLSLEISEVTHEQQQLIVAGTAITRGEDLACSGAIYVFEIITVAPEPERPETNKALKLIVREEVKGPVTAVSSVGTEGFLLAAQGQKCMVRGLKEDNTLLPVAFMDMQCYVSALKNIQGTGLLLMADVLKGVWLTGYAEEPYRMRLFGKSKTVMEALASEFLPDDKQLFILVSDAHCDLHVLEFNPENPKSLSGQRLLHRSTFHMGHFPVSMTALPCSLAATDSAVAMPNGSAETDGDDAAMPDHENDAKQQYNVLCTLQSGAMALVTPLPEDTYRTLGALQTYLSGVLEHPCGLNPRAYRAVESDGFGGRGVLDGGLLRRWWELGTQRRAEAGARVGADPDEIARALDILGGAGLGYL